MKEILSFEQVRFSYPASEPVLEDVSFRIEKGALTALVGVNGVGKSTLTYLATRILLPDKGRITLLDETTATLSNTVKAGMGFLASIDPLFEFLTIDDHLAYVGMLFQLDRTACHQRIVQLKSIFGLEEFDGKLISTLSTGNRKKVGIITTLLHSPSFLIWDEPFNGLDPVAVVRLKELMVKLKGSGVTILITSQVIDFIESICDRVILLHEKKVMYDDTIANLAALKTAHQVKDLESLLYKIGTASKPLSKMDWL